MEFTAVEMYLIQDTFNNAMLKCKDISLDVAIDAVKDVIIDLFGVNPHWFSTNDFQKLLDTLINEFEEFYEEYREQCFDDGGLFEDYEFYEDSEYYEMRRNNDLYIVGGM